MHLTIIGLQAAVALYGVWLAVRGGKQLAAWKALQKRTQAALDERAALLAQALVLATMQQRRISALEGALNVP